ncbi:MAG: hypothetical protein HYT36_00625 [Candidatus Staskawiczbacteria bacterium]|nr:hypothetical protein [Candidatus Staskawiczbacteria bacterium]
MANEQIIILKLGGSAITEKKSIRPRIKKTVVQQLAKELRLFLRRFPKTKIILLHGAGSFGHPLVHRHKLLLQPLTKQKLQGFTETVCSTRRLANLLTDILRDEKLPVLPIQTSAVLCEKNNAMAILNIHNIRQLLDVGIIPLLGGDMGLNAKKQAVVVSADNLAVLLAKAFPLSRIIFATNIDGVFDKFPPSGNMRPISLISRKNLKRLLKKMREEKNQYDITGEMTGKLRTMLLLKEKEIVIFNGLMAGNLTRALIGKPIGTRLVI